MRSIVRGGLATAMCCSISRQNELWLRPRALPGDKSHSAIIFGTSHSAHSVSTVVCCSVCLGIRHGASVSALCGSGDFFGD